MSPWWNPYGVMVVAQDGQKAEIQGKIDLLESPKKAVESAPAGPNTFDRSAEALFDRVWRARLEHEMDTGELHRLNMERGGFWSQPPVLGGRGMGVGSDQVQPIALWQVEVER